MSSTQKYEDFKVLTPGARRREATRKFLQSHPGIRARVSSRADVSLSMVSKVLQGGAVSAKVEEAIAIEETRDAQKAA